MELIAWVDDCLYHSNDPAKEAVVLARLEKLGAKFSVMGQAKWFLGVKITQDLANQTVSLTQSAYVSHILSSSMFGDLTEASPKRTPASESHDIDHSGCPTTPV